MFRGNCACFCWTCLVYSDIIDKKRKENFNMKKMLFYLTNTIICALFLNIRLAFFLFGDVSKLASGRITMINVLTAVIGTIMLLNIYLAYKEAKK